MVFGELAGLDQADSVTAVCRPIKKKLNRGYSCEELNLNRVYSVKFSNNGFKRTELSIQLNLRCHSELRVKLRVGESNLRWNSEGQFS